MKRGEIFFADLNPASGSEITKHRPVLIVSNNANNQVAKILTVLPITSNVTRVYPFEVLITAINSGLSKDSKVQAQQIRTIDKERITGNVVGRLDQKIMDKVDEAIRLHLSI